ncbi:hypothetical protein PSYMO_38528, partial [Pseudomonas amygdali pv. mori str. 301020]
GFLGVADSATHHEMADLYAKALPATFWQSLGRR